MLDTSRIVSYGPRHPPAVAPGSWTTLRYENLLRDPDAELTALAGFIGARPAPRWLAAARRMLESGCIGQAAELSPGHLGALRAVREPGGRQSKQLPWLTPRRRGPYPQAAQSSSTMKGDTRRYSGS
jgi:hypothetical protein